MTNIKRHDPPTTPFEQGLARKRAISSKIPGMIFSSLSDVATQGQKRRPALYFCLPRSRLDNAIPLFFQDPSPPPFHALSFVPLLGFISRYSFVSSRVHYQTSPFFYLASFLCPRSGDPVARFMKTSDTRACTVVIYLSGEL